MPGLPVRAAYTFEMLSTAARYVAQLMLPGGLGLRSTALTSSSISGIHDTADGAIGGTALRGKRCAGDSNFHGEPAVGKWSCLHSTI